MIELTTQEIEKEIEWLSSFTTEEGEGVTRLLYSEEWIAAQNALKERLENAGFKVEFDAVGNLFGTLEGSEDPESIIASGSHVDTVVEAGRFDGQLGILAALVAAEKLVKEEGQPKKSIRVVSMAEEEGSRFPYAFWGSHNIFGIQNEDAVRDADDGGVLGNAPVKFVDAMNAAGFDFNKSGELKFADYDAWIEIHAEQGNFLEAGNKAVGVVNAIVGQKRYNIKLKGMANHAGTTLMSYRRDAMAGFVEIASRANERALEIGDPLVVTFGRIEVKPNVVNVVPGEVQFSIDTRHTDQDALNKWAEELEGIMKEVAEKHNLELEVDNWMDEAPVPMDEGIVNLIEEVSKDLGLDYQVMHSGAGHDTQIFAPRVPSAMIFVPSKDGLSHNPAEYTDSESIVQGVQALAETIKRLAY